MLSLIKARRLGLSAKVSAVLGILTTLGPAFAAAPASDDFHSTSLNTSLWTFVNPLNDGSVSVNGTDATITVPGGTSHDVWSSGNFAPRIMQSISNVDFEVEVKFDSRVTTFSQMQGIIVEQNSSNYLRFDVYHDGASPRLFSASFVNNNPTINVSTPIAAGMPLWLKLKRTGNTWTGSWSNDGTSYTTGVTFNQTLNVTKVGPFAANCCSPAPAFTAQIDHFFNTASPIVPEDGGPPGITPGAVTTTSTGATVPWTTTRPTTSQVSYGTTTAYGSATVLDNTLVSTHSQSISGLVCNTLYHYKVTSANVGGGNSASSADATFTTAACAVVPDLTLTKTHTGNFTRGGTGSYTLTANNVGSAATTGAVTVADTLPTGLTPGSATGSGWSCSTASQTVTCTRSDALAAGASYPAITLPVTVAASAPASVTNTATVSGGGETNTANDTASDPTTIGGGPDLTLTKSHTGNFTQGGAGSYTLTATNSGSAATIGAVTVADTLPTGLTPGSATGAGWSCSTASQTVTCTRSDALAAGTSYPAITLPVTVAASAPASVTNTATVSGGGETNTANDTASDPTTIGGGPDLTLTKSHTGNFTQGGTGSYALTATNSGSAATIGAVTVADTLPTGLTPGSATGAGWSCSTASQTVTCTRSDALAAGASYSAITLPVSVAASAPASVTNTATVSGGGETNTANDTANDPTTIGGGPDLTLTKSHTGNFTQGGTGTYTLTATNSGSAATTGAVTVADTLPTGLTPGSATGAGWSCNTGSQTVTCTRSDALAAGASYPAITLPVSVAASAPASVTNTATVSGGGETNTANDTANDPTTITTIMGPPVSDDFHGPTLNTSLWTFVNPVGDGSYSMNGTNVLLNVPAGVPHDVWTSGNNSVRIMQPIANVDFEVLTRFQSSVTLKYQIQGIIVEQDAASYLRFDAYSDGTSTHLFSASFIAGTPTTQLDTVISGVGASFWLKVKRVGNTWTESWSGDGVAFTTGVTYSQTLLVSKIGPFAANQGVPASASPAFTSSVDYFFNTASPISPADGGTIVISSVSAIPSQTSAAVLWVTTPAATSQVKYGLTSSYTNVTTLDSTLVTNHSVSVTGLLCSTTYHYQVVSTDPGSPNPASSADNTFTTSPCASAGSPVSDNFDSGTLNQTRWTVVDPVEPAASNVTVNSTNLLINVPGGLAHDAWTGGNSTIRAMQSIANVDFDIEVKFRSMVTSQYQFQGLLVEQDSGNYARFDVLKADCQNIVFSTNFVNGNPQTNPIPLNQRIRNGSNFYIRLKRTGNQFTFSYSYDGLRWTTALNQQVYNLNVTKIGVMAGNSAGPSGTAPAFTASVDYFVNRLAPPATEDGQPFPPPSGRPVIDVWYGDSQTFGQLGVPQQWVNILGNVSSAAGLATLTYTLNGGASKALSTGESQFRLAEPGDFNIDIDYASLNPGANSVVINAIDNLGNQTIRTVTVNYVAGQTWPKNYTINWVPNTSVQNYAQIVDGKWQIQPDGTVRTTQTGYDRLLVLGDRSTWGDYEVTAQVTINSMDCHDLGAGIVAGWQGHTLLQYGQPLFTQPYTGHPFPGLAWYSMENAPNSRLDIYENTPSTPETVLIADTSGFQLTPGVKYMYKFRVQRNALGGTHYSYKVWVFGTSEPATWNLQVDGELSQGSIVLGAHRADVSFGQITITGL